MLPRIASLVLVLLVGLASPVSAQTFESVMLEAVQTGPIKNKQFDSSNTLTSVTIAGTIPGGATFSAITLTSPTLSGTVGGSGSWPSPGAIGGGTAASGRFTTLTATTEFLLGTCSLTFGTGSPEGVITKPICSRYLRTDGGTGTTLYVKESGAGNTGWIAIAAGGAVNWAVPGTIGSGTPNTGAFTTLSVTGQFTSTLSTGTAPFVVASTTKVSNLNVDLLDGADFSAPGAIGSVTPAAITGTTVTSTGCLVVVTVKICSGTGSPEGVVTAPVSSYYFRTDGGAGTVTYSKEAGSGNVGWVVVAPAVIDWTTPGTIGSSTPNTGAFTAIAWTRHRGTPVAPTYGASVTIDLSLGDWFTVTATNATAFTISNPSGLSPTAGDEIEITVVNSSGGAITMTTPFDTLYKLASFTKPANGFNRTVRFKYTGSAWREVSCSPEVPN